MTRNSMSRTAAVAQDRNPSFDSRQTSMGWGKCTEKVSTLVPVDLKEEFARAAREHGYASESDALRELVIIFTWGAERLKRLHSDRIDAAAARMT